ncbi:MAG TPA: hypothetical protein VGL76_08310 [Gaiellaceae bacterium]
MTITAWGAADIAGYLRMCAALTADPRFRPGLSILVEQSGLDMSQCTDADVEQIAQSLAERDWNFPPRAVAVVAATPESSAGARLGISFLGGTQSRRRLFDSRDEAAAWLAGQS